MSRKTAILVKSGRILLRKCPLVFPLMLSAGMCQSKPQQTWQAEEG